MTISSPSRFGDLDEGDSFHSPVPGLFVDMEAESGCVALTDEFLQAAPNTRFRILQQWLRALSAHRDSALVAMFREYSQSFQNLTIVEQIDSFRLHCSRHGVPCPSDLAVLLQRY
jgi:hypothetical protein